MEKIFSDEINILKALAIMLVVSGHLEFSLLGIFPPYSFQIALFFFISGCLFKDKYLNSVTEFFERRIKSLLVPYFWYNLFYMCVTILIAKLTGKFWGMPLSFKNFFITPFLNGHQFDLSCPLWFVTQLFMTLITFLYLMRFFSNATKNKFIHLAIFTLIGLLAIPVRKIFPMTPLMLVVIRTMMSLFFVYIGYYYTHYIKDNYNIFAPKWFGGIVILQSILWLFNRDFTPEHGIGLSYILVWGRFDHQLFVPILTSLTGIWASLFTVKILYPYLKNVKFIQDMGNVTYHIMANHLLVMYLITAVFLKLHGMPISERANHDIYWIYNPIQTTYLYFVITMVATTYIGVGLKKIHATALEKLKK